MPEHAKIAGVVLRDKDGRYLLVQEGQGPAYGLWNLPAGHVDEDETTQTAAMREGREETGFEIELIAQDPILIDDTTEERIMKYAFFAKAVGGNLKFPTEELLDARWFNLQEIKVLNEHGKIRSPWVLNAILKVENP